MLLHCDCADNYNPANATSALFNRWWSAVPSAAPAIVAGQGRFGRSAFRFNNGGGTTVTLRQNITASSTVFVGFPFRLAAIPNITARPFVFYDSGSVQVDLRMDNNGFVFFTRNGTQLGNKSAIPWPSSYHAYLQAKIVISPTSGVVQLQIDGVDMPDNTGGTMNYSGQNTRATANSTVNQFEFGKETFSNNNGYDAYITDVVIYNDQGSFNNAFMGDVSVNIQEPTANGTYTDWTNTTSARPASTAVALGVTILDSNSNLQRVTTAGTTGSGTPTWNASLNGTTNDNGVIWTNIGAVSAYKLVNEPYSDDDYSTLVDANVGDRATFTYPSVTGTIKAVVQRLTYRKDDAGTRSIRGYCKSGATTADSGTDLNAASSYVDQEIIWESDPNTSAAWTASNVNSAEFGVKVTA